MSIALWSVVTAALGGSLFVASGLLANARIAAPREFRYAPSALDFADWSVPYVDSPGIAADMAISFREAFSDKSPNKRMKLVEPDQSPRV